MSGRFDVAVTVGSRQWGLRELGLAADLGRLDTTTGGYDRDVRWMLNVRTP
jgi:hypothetical protein